MNRKNGRPIIVPFREPMDAPDERVYCTERGTLCLGCPYPRHGFICWFSDGTCLKTEYNRLTTEGAMKQANESYTYTLADCACRYCLHDPGKMKPCPLPECCCAEEKRLATATPRPKPGKHADKVKCPA